MKKFANDFYANLNDIASREYLNATGINDAFDAIGGDFYADGNGWSNAPVQAGRASLPYILTIVNGTTALYAIYAKQNPNLEGEELLDSFMKTIRGGIQTGYQDAMSILEGIGALKFEGVGQGIAKTMQLVDEKLLAFENSKREQLGIML